jgi:CsoR family transcriptional regulator, copper-sensing transcriptional repressor
MTVKNGTKESIIRRLQIVEGHVKKVRVMVESDAYCVDVLHQTQAIESALREVDSLIMENHLNTCVVDAIKKGKSKEVIAEVMNVIKRNSK